MLPQIKLIHLMMRGIFSLKRVMNVAKVKNQVNEAIQTPMMKYFAMSASNVALKPPSKSDPSMMACGLSQVTAKQDKMVLINVVSTVSLVVSFAVERINPMPM